MSLVAETHPEYSFLHANSELWTVDEAWNTQRISITLQTMENTQFFLDTLSSSLSENITRAKHIVKRITPEFLGLGLASLPDDVLAMIIELSAEPLERSTMGAHKLAGVSRRFRAVTLKLPKTWCAVSSKTHDFERALLHPERSKTMGLHVSYQELYEVIHSKSLMQALVPFASRWRSFSYTKYHSAIDSSATTEHHTSLQLPQLEHLGVEADNDHFYKEYFMPNLRSATFHNMIPVPFSTSLTHLAMKFESLDRGDPWDIDGFRRFLHSTPLLVELRLFFEAKFRTFICELPDPEVLLLHLKTLSVITVCDKEEDLVEGCETASDFLATIRAPNLSHLVLGVKVFVVNCSAEPVSEFFNGLLPLPSSSPALAFLDIAVMGVERPHGDEDPLHIRYDRVPRLTHLKLETNLNVTLVHSDDNLPPLRRVEFVGCTNIDNDFVMSLFRRLRADPVVWKALEGVIFRACPFIDLDGNSNIDHDGKFHSEHHRHAPDDDIKVKWEHDEDDFYPSGRTIASQLKRLLPPPIVWD
ncbi:hypothetical protein SCHPADRAFT_287313 [Schizopora paradoxa]|uniref:F-box domain-containing protein n=1 Tax=Schizopora paradoxa TaxID=27342 RepID=A0A0H2RTS0_9AGAM|nr:hypothetical protein SCHPADRAFT_287313 [Schizopora paradoxa]